MKETDNKLEKDSIRIICPDSKLNVSLPFNRLDSVLENPTTRRRERRNNCKHCEPGTVLVSPMDKPIMTPSKDIDEPQIIQIEDDRTENSIQTLQGAIADNLFYVMGRFPENASPNDSYMALTYTVCDRLLQHWLNSLPIISEDRCIFPLYQDSRSITVSPMPL